MNEFERLEKQAKAETNLDWKILSSEELKKIEVPVDEKIIEGLFPKNSITLIVGEAGCGKSWIELEMAKSIAIGKALFDKFQTQKNKVLIVDEEVDVGETKRRWTKLISEGSEDVYFMNLQGFKIDNEVMKEKLLNICIEKEYRVVFFDALRDINDLQENDSTEIQKIINCFKDFIKNGITVGIIDHTRKDTLFNSQNLSQKVRGSNVKVAGADCIIHIQSEQKAEGVLEYTISPAKYRRGTKLAPFKVILSEIEDKMLWTYQGEIEQESTKLNNAKEAIFKLLSEGQKTPTEIVKTLMPTLFLTERTIKRAISEMRDTKEIIPTKQGRNVYYSMTSAKQ